MSSMPAIIGHRGARGEAPENTLAGFRQALQAGVQGIELDVRLSSDGHPVVLHDHDVWRTTGYRRNAGLMTRAELGALDARRASGGWHSPVGVPSLEEVIHVCPEIMNFQFEVKPAPRGHLDQLRTALADLIDHNEMAARTIISSSHRPFLSALRRQAPHLRLGYVFGRRRVRGIRHCLGTGAGWLIAHYSHVSAGLMQRVREQGLRLSAWTVNDLALADRLAELGVDSLITDYPTAFIAHFHGPGRRNRHSRENAPDSGPPESEQL